MNLVKANPFRTVGRSISFRFTFLFGAAVGQTSALYLPQQTESVATPVRHTDARLSLAITLACYEFYPTVRPIILGVIRIFSQPLRCEFMKIFEHKTLGRFTQQDYCGELRWQNEVDLSAFAAFKYLGNRQMRRSNKVSVSIYSESDPPKSAIETLMTIRRTQWQLVKNICRAFFDDLHQQGYDDESLPHSRFGMWWSRDPVQVALSCREVLQERLNQDRIWRPEDLFAVLYEPSIEVFPSMTDENGIPRTLVEMGAEFEDEHGVSVRTDGKEVLSLGYSGEA